MAKTTSIKSTSVAKESASKIRFSATALSPRRPNAKAVTRTFLTLPKEASSKLPARQRWFEVMRACGDDVRELLHSGHPTACVADAAFAYVNAFKAHVNVGCFRGDEIAEPQNLLEGTGKFMRHVKLRPGSQVDARALTKLIETAYTDTKRRRKAE